MDFLQKENQCGQNLLRIVSRGSAIIAELFRLSSNIPEVFLGQDKIKDPEQKKYLPIIFDFQYLREPEEFEKKINENTDLLDLDNEFQDNHKDILLRFYKLFESIWKYQNDISKFVEDVLNGYYLQHSLENIIQDIGGRQILSEAIFLYGIMLLLLEDKLPGYIRERMIISIYRYQGEIGLEHIDEVCKLCRNTGYSPNYENKRPKNHPESFFARFPPHSELIRLVLGRLQTDDIYLMANSFPNPDHRSTRLSNQASMIYVILFFSPDILHKQKATMREIVDKYFNDNWMIAMYMGYTIDLTVEWSSYPAAKYALDNVLTLNSVKQLNEKNARLISKSFEDLKLYLKEGLLQQEYLLDNMDNLMNCVRDCNIALRWRLLHRKTKNEFFKKAIEQLITPQQVIALLLNASQLEYLLKEILKQLLNDKELAWTDGKIAAAQRMFDLSEYFTGEKALTKVKRDENLMNWFSQIGKQVESLNLEEVHATATGRKIQNIIAALEDVEQFEAVDTNIQIKSFLNEAREIFRAMIRTVNIKSDVLNILESISDLSYAWQTLTDYIPFFHDRICQDPSSVVLLRATFLKAASMLDVPLVRISAIDSPDIVSVAAFYSGELIEFVRLVLEIIPKSVFNILGQIVALQTDKMRPIPIRLESKDMKDYAQLDVRCELSKLTYQVSIFTEGILVMEKTLLGIIQVEPRQILEEGLRRELVRLISYSMNNTLTFKDWTKTEIYEKMSKIANTLDSFRKSIEYLQDYISIPGLKIFQQEFSRIINYNTEQEANRFLKKKIFDSVSRYQSKAIPIPRLISPTSSLDNEESFALTFMGRVMDSLFVLTDPIQTIYSPECSSWFISTGLEHNKPPITLETCGIRLISLLEKSIGVIGLRGLDKLLGFRIVHSLNSFVKFYETQVYPFRTLLDQVRVALHPEHKTPANHAKIYTQAIKKVELLMPQLMKFIRKIGQIQLLRRQVMNSLQFGCQLDAHLLYHSLDTFNKSVVKDVRQFITKPEKNLPDDENPLLFELSSLLDSCGLEDPLQKIYVTSLPLEGLPVLLFLFLLTYLPKLEYDEEFGTLVRKKSKYPLDGSPLAVGLACLLKQFHPSYTKKLMSYIGQFIRSNLLELFCEAELKALEFPKEITNMLIFIDHFCYHSSISRNLIHSYIPPYVFDSLHFLNSPKK